MAAECLSAAGGELLDNRVLFRGEERKFMSMEAKNIRSFYSRNS